MIKRKLVSLALITSIGFVAAGCETKAESGALIGAGSGAALGAIIGNQSHHRSAEGALIGTGVGAIGGALIGNEMDKQDRQRERERQQEYADYRQSDAPQAVTKSDVIKWASRGTRDDVIIDRIERSGTVFHLSRQDEQDLRDGGVSEMVIQEMRSTAQR
jgi:uncharacterized protein YcfJ